MIHSSAHLFKRDAVSVRNIKQTPQVSLLYSLDPPLESCIKNPWHACIEKKGQDESVQLSQSIFELRFMPLQISFNLAIVGQRNSRIGSILTDDCIKLIELLHCF